MFSLGVKLLLKLEMLQEGFKGEDLGKNPESIELTSTSDMGGDQKLNLPTNFFKSNSTGLMVTQIDEQLEKKLVWNYTMMLWAVLTHYKPMSLYDLVWLGFMAYQPL